MTTSSESPERFAEWDNAKPGDKVDLYGPDGAGPCGDSSSTDLQCTRDQGHEGQHVATGAGVVIETWGGAA